MPRFRRLSWSRRPAEPPDPAPAEAPEAAPQTTPEARPRRRSRGLIWRQRGDAASPGKSPSSSSSGAAAGPPAGPPAPPAALPPPDAPEEVISIDIASDSDTETFTLLSDPEPEPEPEPEPDPPRATPPKKPWRRSSMAGAFGAARALPDTVLGAQLAWNPAEPRLLATPLDDGHVAVLDDCGDELERFALPRPDPPVDALAWSPDGQWLLVLQRGVALAWRRGAELPALLTKRGVAVAWAATPHTALVLTKRKGLLRVDVEREQRESAPCGAPPVRRGLLSAELAVVESGEGGFEAVPLARMEEALCFEAAAVEPPLALGGGRAAFRMGSGGAVMLCSTGQRRGFEGALRFDARGSVVGVAWARPGKLLLLAFDSGAVTLVGAAGRPAGGVVGQEVLCRQMGGAVSCAAVSLAADALAVGLDGNRVRVVTLFGPAPRRAAADVFAGVLREGEELPAPGGVRALKWSEDGRRLAVVDEDGGVVVHRS